MKHRLGLLIICAILVIGIGLSGVSCQAKPAPTTSTPTAKPAPATPAAASPAATTAPIKWRAQSALPPNAYAWVYQIDPFIKLVNERSKGRLTIELFAPGAIVDAYGQFGAVQKGAIEVAMGVGGYNIKDVPEADIEQGLPGTFASLDDFTDFFMNYKNAAFYTLLDGAYRGKGNHLLRSISSNPQVIMSKKSIPNADALKGLKIRASGSYVDLVKNLGAVPVELAPAEVFMALQSGTIDATIQPDYLIGTLKYWDVAKGMLMPSIGPSTGDMYVNLKAYDSLPADLKKIVDDAAAEVVPGFDKGRKEQTSILLDQAVKDHGVTIVTLTAADYAKVTKAAEPILAKATGISPLGAQLVGLIKEYLAQKK